MTDDTDGPPRKGRSNAILTYEEIANFREGQIRLEEKLDGMAEKVSDIRVIHTDHEVRIKALEMASAVVTAVATSAQSSKVWLIATALSVPSCITAIITCIKYFGGN